MPFIKSTENIYILLLPAPEIFGATVSAERKNTLFASLHLLGNQDSIASVI